MKAEIENELITLKSRILEREQKKFKKKAAQLICKSFSNYLPKAPIDVALLEK
jgi:hypothetical protein